MCYTAPPWCPSELKVPSVQIFALIGNGLTMITLVILQMKFAGSSSETSPGTSSLIETVNNQGLVMRTQPK